MTRITRRQVLQAALSASAALLVRTHRAAAREKRTNGKRAIVVGAGMAGITAAKKLAAGGFEVVVIEARDRIGGRVWTDRSLGTAIDLGASWIHGANGNPMTALAEELKIDTRYTDYDDVFLYGPDGNALDLDEVERYAVDFEQLIDSVMSRSEDLDADVSIARGIEREVAEERISADERRFLDWFVATQEVAAAASMDELSLRHAEAGEDLEGGDYLFPGGFDQIVKHLAVGLDIRTGESVRKIRIKGAKVEIDCTAKTLDADIAVITLPLGVLKRDAVSFEPALPERKREAIRRLGMGTLNKVALRFPKAFWPVEHHFFGHVSARKDEFPMFLNFRKYIDMPVLMAFAAGPFAREIEKLPDHEIGGRVMGIVRRLFSPEIPAYEKMVMSRWSSDPFAGGSYSYIAVGGTPADYDTLAEPIEAKLFFAGEATHRNFAATVHGAYFSGLRAAEQAADAMA